MIFNLTGGQKPQSLALWEVFTALGKSKPKSFSACYQNFSNNALEYWQYDDLGTLPFKELEVNEPMSIQELLKARGYVFQNQPTKIYSDDGDAVDFSGFDQTCVKSQQDRRRLFKFGRGDFELDNVLLRKYQATSPLKDEPNYGNGKLFEDYLSARVQDYLFSKPTKAVFEAYTDVKISKSEDGPVLAEYDLLMVDYFGKAVALEAKVGQSGAKDKKDADARKRILRSWAGNGARMYYVFMYFKDDRNAIGDNHLKFPKLLFERGENFCVVSKSDFRYCHFHHNGDKLVVNINDMPGKYAIEIQHLDEFIDSLYT